MSIATLGNSIYLALADDGMAIAKIRTEASSLALSIAMDPTATAQVTSATVNGQSFSSRPAMTVGERLQLLRWICRCADNCGPISTTQITRF